jgi:hypothetical protein
MNARWHDVDPRTRAIHGGRIADVAFDLTRAIPEIPETGDPSPRVVVEDPHTRAASTSRRVSALPEIRAAGHQIRSSGHILTLPTAIVFTRLSPWRRAVF